MSQPTTGELRRSAHRLMQLGVLRSFVPDDEQQPTRYTSVTTTGDTLVLSRRDAAPYLQGLAHGQHAERERAVPRRRPLRSPVDGAPVPERGPLFVPPRIECAHCGSPQHHTHQHDDADLGVY